MQNTVFGKMPPKPDHLRVMPIAEDRTLFGGRATRKDFKLICEIGEKSASFPVIGYFPRAEQPVPLLLVITSDEDDFSLPAEDVTAIGFGILSFSLSDISANDGNFRSGIASLFSIHRKAAEATGKLALWAWAVMRIVDALPVISEIDSSRIFTVGNRLCGRVALLAALYDDRIAGTLAEGVGLSVPSVSQNGDIATFGLTELYPHLYSPKFASSAADSLSFAEQIDFSTRSENRYFMFGTAEFDREIPVEKELAVPDGISHCTAVGEIIRKGNVSLFVHHGGADFSKETLLILLRELTSRLSCEKTAKNRNYFLKRS